MTFRLMRQLATLAFVLALTPAAAWTQAPPQRWHALWISAPNGPARDFDVLYFRKTLTLQTVPQHLVVRVSADTRFELHVNGQRAGAGPALSDVQHWHYETLDLAPLLHTGDNWIAAEVWNFGTAAAVAQMSSQTAFLLSAENAQFAALDSGPDWQVAREQGRSVDQDPQGNYYAAGAEEVMDGRKTRWDWDTAKPNPEGWAAARSLGNAAPAGAQDSPTRWILEPDTLPQMQYEPVTAGHVVRVAGVPAGTSLDKPVVVPPHTHATLLLDRDTLTTAFPALHLQGGKDAALRLTYAEALYDEHGQKGNRNLVEGRQIHGIHDRILADGEDRTYRSLWWRTWRYLQIDVDTANAPLTLAGLTAYYTAYPFQQVGSFASNDRSLARIWQVGWRTAQLCAHETYMDTPYWEQLQYVGDTRIQAMISYGVTGDDRLARQAMLAYRNSLLTEGITQSRYPSNLTQVIPPFSLLWVGMLHDFYLYRDDPAFVASLLPSTRGTLDWFSARQRPDGLLARIEWWPFLDWSPPVYNGGVPPQEADGGSSALTLQYIEALQNAAEMEDRFGEPERAARYREHSRRAADALLRLNWDATSGLLADTPTHKTYSQQANALAVLLDVIPHDQQMAVMRRTMAAEHSALSPASYYFRYYVARALVHAGLGDKYIAELQPWRDMLALGLSTWAENPEPTRSDSHAWSAHPTLDLIGIVAGIGPGSPGFHTVRIEPHLGPLHQAAATMATPQGKVQVEYTQSDAGWSATITLPDHVTGELVWRGNSTPLHGGTQTLTLAP
ncbi:MAG: alpha-L-rhamnosidase N-terminal domain-containing protein [Acidobacteriota bacterium]|nr:alpha-L-rhamnosidase N-terminal domain-containing protein [Acidobacteriota bacterium]